MRVLVVDDHEVVRKGLISMMRASSPEMDFIEVGDGEGALKQLHIEKIDMALVDIRLGNENGLDLVEKGMGISDQTKFVVLTSSSRRGDFDRAKEMGVAGYILKDSNMEDIIYGVLSVARGRKYYDPIIAERESTSDYVKVLDTLTDREREIFVALGKGYTNTQIAQEMYIAESTVKKHMSNIMTKLGVANRTEVALRASQMFRRKEDSK